jgi:hypothetical protein
VASFFDTGSEGWTAIGDTVTGIEYLPTEGRTGGGVRVKDEAVGGVWYFVAGSAYLGDQDENYGKLLRFDIRQVISGGANQFLSDDIILEGGGLKLVYDLPVKPSTTGDWLGVSVPLAESVPWKVGSAAGPLATGAQIQAVLGNLTSLRIRGEYQTGPDSGYLDNVRFGANAEPAAASLGIALLPVLTLEGELGSRYRIDYSEAMDGNWQELTTLQLAVTPYKMVDYSAEGRPRRFYRAVPLP